jgi:sterol desaturase/sphingolipid hydroxylase (fatty acid hydroxylase superfamily)
MSLAAEEPRVAPAAIQWTVFPAVFLATVGVAIALIERGVDPALAIVGPQLASVLILAWLERVYPRYRSWNRSRGDVWVDARHAITITILPALTLPASTLIGVTLAGWLSGVFGSNLWPNHWPLAAQLVLVLIVGEFPQYWVHRLQHEHDWLWGFHAVHHSAPRLYWLNATRFHPIDILMNLIPSFILLVALGCDIQVIALFGLAASVHGIFQHANLQLRLGWLNWFFSMAELHRWHHSPVIREANSNYGQQLIVWDIVFGTRFLPADREPPEAVGMLNLDAFPMTYLDQLASPFRWSAIKAASVR